MPDRIATAADVTAVLAEAFRGQGAFLSTPREVEARINWRRRFLQHDREAWDALVIRAQSVAAGDSARERYMERGGWTPKLYETAWRRGAEAIAEGLVRERVNAAQVDSWIDAEERLERAGLITIDVTTPQPFLLTREKPAQDDIPTTRSEGPS